MDVNIWIRTIIVTLAVMLWTPLSLVHASQPEPAQVIIIYDSLAKGTSREGNIEGLQRLLASYGVKVDQVTFDNYNGGTLAEYSSVIVVRNADESTISNSDFINDFEAYEGGYLHIGAHLPAKIQTRLHLKIQTSKEQFIKLSIGQWSESSIRVKDMPYIIESDGIHYGSISTVNGDMHSPYGVQSDRLAYVPYYEQGNLSEIAIAYILKDWLKVTDQGRTYVLFKEIYPFSDLRLLEKLADDLYNAGIPFIASVRPVFSNTDFPAMHRYLETLKYVQSRNGSILINEPVVTFSIDENDGPILKDQIESFVDVLANYGIAPLGMGAEMYWSYDQQYSEFGMGFFNSVALFPNEEIRYRSQTASSQPFGSSIYSIQLDFLKQFEHTGKAIPDLPMDIALTYNFLNNEDQLNQNIQTLIDSWITFDDYKYENHSVHTQSNLISSQNGLLKINGQKVDMNDAYKDIDFEYSYKQEQVTSFTTFFNIQNKIFIVLILITLVAFGLLFIIGQRLYKRKYLNQRRQL